MGSGRGTTAQSRLELYRERLGWVALGKGLDGQSHCPCVESLYHTYLLSNQQRQPSNLDCFVAPNRDPRPGQRTSYIDMYLEFLQRALRNNTPGSKLQNTSAHDPINFTIGTSKGRSQQAQAPAGTNSTSGGQFSCRHSKTVGRDNCNS